MKTIGLVGGMTWKSTLEYYRIINEHINSKLGRFHSARIILHSIDFELIYSLQEIGHWKKIAEIIAEASLSLESQGADFIVLCSNTIHNVANDVEKSLNIPILNIADVTAKKISEKGFTNIGFLGTKFIIEDGFFEYKLKSEYGIKVIMPDINDINYINSVIFEELVNGIVYDESKKKIFNIMDNLTKKGAEGIILGCTEIPQIIKQSDTKILLFNTLDIHASAAADMALRDV